MRGRHATRGSRRALAPIVLGQNGQAVRIVFLLQPLGGRSGFAFEIVATRGGLAAPPLGEISIVALGAGVHGSSVDGANETLRQLALGRRTSGFHDDLTWNVAPVKDGQAGHDASFFCVAPSRNARIPSRPVKRRS